VLSDGTTTGVRQAIDNDGANAAEGDKLVKALARQAKGVP